MMVSVAIVEMVVSVAVVEMGVTVVLLVGVTLVLLVGVTLVVVVVQATAADIATGPITCVCEPEHADIKSI